MRLQKGVAWFFLLVLTIMESCLEGEPLRLERILPSYDGSRLSAATAGRTCHFSEIPQLCSTPLLITARGPARSSRGDPNIHLELDGASRILLARPREVPPIDAADLELVPALGNNLGGPIRESS